MVSIFKEIKRLAEIGFLQDEAGAKAALKLILDRVNTALDTQKDWKRKNG